MWSGGSAEWVWSGEEWSGELGGCGEVGLLSGCGQGDGLIS